MSADTPAEGGVLTGTWALIRLILRRDRIRVPVWILSIVAFTVSFLPAMPDLYPDQQALDGRAALMENPATIAMTGPGFGVDDYTFGAMVANEYLGYVAILVALMSVFLVVRHTRAEEETGRAELVRAGVVGRYAPLTAAVSVVLAANLVIALLLIALMPPALPELDVAGTALFAASAAGTGLVFTGVGAVVAQLTYAARGATGLGLATLAVAYLLRAIGDAGDLPALSWSSPIGWTQQTASYVDDTWWPLALSVGATVATLWIAVLLSRRRDVGLGLFAPRKGSARAGVSLSGPIGLAWRLQRGTVIAWSVGLAVFGLVYGSIAPEIEKFANENPFVSEAISQEGTSLTEGFFGMVVMMFSMLAIGFVLQSVLRARGEESAGRAEPLLARPVSRARFLVGHVIIAAVVGPLLSYIATLSMGLSASASLGDWSMLPDLVLAATVYIPAIWIFVGIAVALFGLLPRLTALVWATLVYVVVVNMLGIFLQLPDWMMEASPLSHIPRVPADDVTAAPLLTMTAIAVVLLTAGFVGFRRRDLA
ncbi:ABC transporter permease [Stackebrandtia soli]|uniref:ABC transporter permease n=1 Tax=Stackebrandtia soli TaxID=1892856 RepID=UPI0039E97B23